MISLNNQKSQKVMTAISLITLGSIYLLLAFYKTQYHFHIFEGDTPQFMNYARIIAVKYGSFENFIAALYKGEFLLSNRHPLFPMLLSLWESNDISWFLNGKLLNIFLGFFYVYIFYYIIRSESNEEIALLSTFLLIMNDVFIWQTTMISAEPILLITSSMAFYFIIKGFENNKLWIAAGIFSGLAYLSKGSGLFIPFGFLMFLLYDTKMKIWKLFKNKYLWLYAFCFIIICSPLLVRNTVAFGFPFYNKNVQMLAMSKQGWLSGNPSSTTMDSLLSGGILYLIKRSLFGLVEEIRVIIDSLSTFSIYYNPKHVVDTYSLFQKVVAYSVAVIMLITAIITFIKMQYNKKKKMLLLFLFLGFYLPLSWYSVTSPHRRYIIPVSIIFIVLFSVSLVKLFDSYCIKSKLADKLKSKLNLDILKAKHLVVPLLLLILILFPVFNTIPDFSKTYRIEDYYHELAGYLKKNLKPGEYFLQRDGNKTYSWRLFYPKLYKHRMGFSNLTSYQKLKALLKKNPSINYILIDAVTYHFGFDAFNRFITKDVNKKYVEIGDKDGLSLIKPIPGWKAVLTDPYKPVEFILFKKEKTRMDN